MKKLLLSLLATLFVSGLFAQMPSWMKEYQNKKYEYFFYYPKDFNGMGESDSEDGQTFVSADGENHIQVYGGYNAQVLFGTSFPNAYKDKTKKLQSQKAKILTKESMNDPDGGFDNAYVLSYLQDGLYHYVRTIWWGDYSATVDFTIYQEDRETYDDEFIYNVIYSLCPFGKTPKIPKVAPKPATETPKHATETPKSTTKTNKTTTVTTQPAAQTPEPPAVIYRPIVPKPATEPIITDPNGLDPRSESQIMADWYMEVGDFATFGDVTKQNITQIFLSYAESYSTPLTTIASEKIKDPTYQNPKIFEWIIDNLWSYLKLQLVNRSGRWMEACCWTMKNNHKLFIVNYNAPEPVVLVYEHDAKNDVFYARPDMFKNVPEALYRLPRKGKNIELYSVDNPEKSIGYLKWTGKGFDYKRK